MANAGAASSRPRRSLFDALFGEAWDLERRRRRRFVGLVVLVCLAAGASVALTDGGQSSPPAVASGEPVALHAEGVVGVGAGPQTLLSSAGSLWVATPRSVVRLNLHNGSRIARLPIPTNGVDAGLAFGAGSIWLAPTGTSELLRIDPSNNRIVSRIPLGRTGYGHLRSLGGGVAFAADRIWVSRDSNQPRGDVITVNPRTNRATGTPLTVGSGPGPLASAFGSIWVDNTSITIGTSAPAQTYPAMTRINSRSRQVSTEPFSGAPSSAFGSLWVQTDPGSDDATILRVDPANGNFLAQINVPRAVAITASGGRVWAISYPRSRSASIFEPIKDTAALWQINPHTNRIIGKPIRLPLTQPDSIVVSKRQLWIADYDTGKLTHFALIAR